MSGSTITRGPAEASRVHAHDTLLTHPARAALEAFTGRPVLARVERRDPGDEWVCDRPWIPPIPTTPGHTLQHPQETAWSVISGWVLETVPEGCESRLVSVSGPHRGWFGSGPSHEVSIVVTDPDFGSYRLLLTVEWAIQ
jgi:hypothetical protein